MDNLGGWDQSEDHPDFDPNLLTNVDSWAVDNDGVDHVHHHVNNIDQHSRKSRSHSNQWTNLGVTDFDEQDNNNNSSSSSSNKTSSNNQASSSSSSEEEQVTISTETAEAAVEAAAVAAISVTSGSVTSGNSPFSAGDARINQNTQHHLHPLGIQSSASCPGIHTTTTSTSTDNGSQYSAMSFPQHHHEHQGLCSIDLSQALERSVAAPPSSASSTNQNMSSLAANFMMAQSGNSSFIAAAAAAAAAGTTTPSCVTTATNVADITHQLQQQIQQQPCTIPSSIKHKTTTVPTSKTNKKTKSTKVRASRQSKPSSSKTRKKKTNNSTSATSGGSSSSLPPFYLFDAPVELRANFMQNQRRLGLPIQNDPNSYHYGETVNGFHPHQYQLPLGATEATATATSSGPGGGLPSPPAATVVSATGGTGHHHRPKHVPQLIDARHGNSNRKNKGGQVKNEREQKRAQKITELIEQLRLQMEDGGWQVEARSKFHTLSNCAEYVKHMITSTSEKEKTNEKLKSDLDEKQRKLEREKEETAIQEGRSDPESVTSSLTSNMSDNTLSSSRHNEEDRRIGGGNNKNNKRKLSDDTDQEGSSRDTNIKKVCTVSSETTFEDSSGSGSGSGSGGNSGDGPSAHGCSISKTISTVSDMTGSNRGSISNNSSSRGESSDDVPTEQDSPSGLGDGGEQLSTSSISSDAAVANEKTSRDSHSCHKDVVFNNDKRMGRKRPPEEVTSLERSFELNYEEVFDKSNIPQLIASTSGKIVTWNECFAKATGYRRSEIERMTIFSLVKPENLANFFEIVAAALRPPDDNMEKNNETANEESTNNLPENDATATPVTTLNECSKEKKGDEVDINDDSGKSTHEETTVNSKQADETDKEENEAIPEHLLDYTAMTLPCIDFPAMRKRNQAAAADSNSVAIPPLHVTITLMSDKDPRRRCFHCVFTNSTGTDKKMGIITPELLASLFAKPSRRRRKYHSSHGRQRKRARGSNENHSVKQISNEQPECPPSPLLMPPPYGKEQMKEQDSSNSVKSEDIEEMSIDDIM